MKLHPLHSLSTFLNDDILKLQHYNKLISNEKALRVEEKEMASAENQKSVWASRYVKVLTHDRIHKVEKDFAICLPPKTGSSNWEAALIKKFYGKEYTLISQDNVQYFPDQMYTILPRLQQKQDLDGAIRILNARNPIIRMASGWHDKMKIGTKSERP